VTEVPEARRALFAAALDGSNEALTLSARSRSGARPQWLPDLVDEPHRVVGEQRYRRFFRPIDLATIAVGELISQRIAPDYPSLIAIRCDRVAAQHRR